MLLLLRKQISTAIFFNEHFYATFDVYVEDGKFEDKCGGDHCIWTAQYDGFYL